MGGQPEACGCRLVFLPRYSPDFNPIKGAFSKLKTFLRRVQARTREALEVAIGAGLQTISAQDAQVRGRAQEVECRAEQDVGCEAVFDPGVEPAEIRPECECVDAEPG